MKQTLRRELTNILFVVLIVAAAVVIYLLSRGERPAAVQSPESAANQSVASAEPSAPASAPTEKPATRGVPEAVFLSHLQTDPLFSAEPIPGQSNVYKLFFNESPRIYATLRYELEQGLLSSVEVKFPLAAEKKANEIAWLERELVNTKQALNLLQTNVMQTVLGDLLPASVAKDEMQQASVRYWVDQALLLKKDGDDFEDTQDGLRFLAYRNQGETAHEMICVLFLS